MEQTAVEWLEDQICTIQIGASPEWLLEAIEQAKEIEKEQIIDTYKKAQILMVMDSSKQAEQYYNETFKSK